jgi:hypothetical protein
LNCLADAADGIETVAGTIVAIIARIAVLYFMVPSGSMVE